MIPQYQLKCRNKLYGEDADFQVVKFRAHDVAEALPGHVQDRSKACQDEHQYGEHPK